MAWRRRSCGHLLRHENNPHVKLRVLGGVLFGSLRCEWRPIESYQEFHLFFLHFNLDKNIWKLNSIKLYTATYLFWLTRTKFSIDFFSGIFSMADWQKNNNASITIKYRLARVRTMCLLWPKIPITIYIIQVIVNVLVL